LSQPHPGGHRPGWASRRNRASRTLLGESGDCGGEPGGFEGDGTEGVAEESVSASDGRTFREHMTRKRRSFARLPYHRGTPTLSQDLYRPAIPFQSFATLEPTLVFTPALHAPLVRRARETPGGLCGRVRWFPGRSREGDRLSPGCLWVRRAGRRRCRRCCRSCR
jgi:hypothetical protein